ncbi:MAG: CRTAC1 family protein [Planctomycetaceae bacterium]|nr:CRTAC1 family protein [Planctomycetaceae bacterium]
MNQQNPSDDEVDYDVDDKIIGRALRWSMLVFAIAAAVGGSALFLITRPQKPEVRIAPSVAAQIRERPKVEIPESKFTDITASSGIKFVHENGAAGEKLLPETMGGGCAFLDFDSDGDQDLLLVNSQRWPWDKRESSGSAKMALYQNDGTGKFTDATTGSGLDVSMYGMGVAVGDFDNDGDEDVFLSALGPNKLFRNTGGKFEDVTADAGVGSAPHAWSTSCGFFDADNDGDLDLFVCNYLQWTRETDISQDFQLIGGGRAYGRPQNFPGSHCQFFLNEGDGKFTDRSEAAGIQIKNPYTGVPMAKSLGLAFHDFDEDGWMDVVVANDTVQNFLFHNLKNGTFEEVATLSGIAYDMNGAARGAMGIDIAHFRTDDSVGVSIGNFSNEMAALYVSHGSTLQFNDEAVPSGFGPSTRLALTFGVFFFDYDLDGRLDLLCANGHLEEDINKVQQSQHYEQSPQLFWNAGSKGLTEFEMVPTDLTGPDFAVPIVGRGAAYADIDNDGDLDILLTTTGKEARLFRNDLTGNRNSLRLKLTGTTCNRDAIGAEVELKLGSEKFIRPVMPTRSYISQVELPVTIGLGSRTGPAALRINWPGGEVQELPVDIVAGVNRLELTQTSKDATASK